LELVSAAIGVGTCAMVEGEIVTVAEIRLHFDSEWVLICDAKTDEQNKVIAGKLLWHSKDRDEVHRKMLELMPDRCATIYTGRPPENMVFVL
jgi:hypothetical protein